MTVCLADVFVFPILEGHVFSLLLGFVCFLLIRFPPTVFASFSLGFLCFESSTYKARGRIGRINFQLHKDFFIAVVKKKWDNPTTLEKIGIPTISYTHMYIYISYYYNILHIYIFTFVDSKLSTIIPQWFLFSATLPATSWQFHLSGPCSCVECHGLGTVLGCESCGVVKKPCHVCQQALLGCEDVKGKV